jgi:Apea-like HEPN
MPGSNETETNTPSFAQLEDKWKRILDGSPAEHIRDRFRRALSWLGRAEKEANDPDVRFILLWISFNSAYSADRDDPVSERSAHNTYFEGLVGLDREHRIYNSVWKHLSKGIWLLLGNKYIFDPFWKNQNGWQGYGDWGTRLASSKNDIDRARARRDTAKILSILFGRLYVLRNQLVHGGATWNGTVNRTQVRDGAAVLGGLLPVMIDIMMDTLDHDWGKPYFPVVD